jgi:hypothetical protein
MRIVPQGRCARDDLSLNGWTARVCLLLPDAHSASGAPSSQACADFLEKSAAQRFALKRAGL